MADEKQTTKEDEVRRCLKTASRIVRLANQRLILSRAKLQAFGCNADEIKSLAYDWEIQE